MHFWPDRLHGLIIFINFTSGIRQVWATADINLHPIDMTRPVAFLSSKLPSFHPRGLFSRLLLSLHLIDHSKSSLGGVIVSSPTIDVPDRSEPALQIIDRSIPMDPDAVCEHLIDLVSRIPSLLPDSGEWLERGVLEVVGDHPIAAGDVADIWAGMMRNRKVAIKSYRYSSSSNYMPTYVVSDYYFWCVPPADDLLVEVLQRGIRMQPSQGPEYCTFYRDIFCSQTSLSPRF